MVVLPFTSQPLPIIFALPIPVVVVRVLVSRHLRVLPTLSQPRPPVCGSRFSPIRLSAQHHLFAVIAPKGVERTLPHGLFCLLSAHRSNRVGAHFYQPQAVQPHRLCGDGQLFMYYLIYLFLPVAGPQYYFHAVGFEVIQSGHFPQLGDYFRYHTELAISPGPDGFFRELVERTQQSGERPTAAFPSSHVGMSTVLMFLLWNNRRWLFAVALPFYFFLCCATVYIQAHYLIDVFGGFVTAIIFYYFTNWLYLRRRARILGAAA